MTRIDQLLVLRGVAPTRSAAQRLIAGGAVRWRMEHAEHDWQRPRKAGEELPENCEIEITDDAELRFVSRGGVKLEGALAAAGVEARGLVCLDLGQSTGGFTDCLLQAGAARVIGIDVGHGQLHASLRADPRVTSIEGMNVRELPGAAAALPAFSAARAAGGFELVVADLSFISLKHALGPAAALLKAGGTLLALVKPQFELGRRGVDARGIVRDQGQYAGLRDRIEQAARDCGLTPWGWYDSSIRGGDGNHEFFLHARLQK